MKKLTALIALLLCLAMLAGCGGNATPTTEGNGMREYVISQTQEGAYRSLSEALAAVKADENTLEAGEGVQITVQGTVQVKETMYITAEDLPSVDHPVLVKGADSNSGFSGGMQVTEFELWKDNIWCAKIPEITQTRHLYIDGKIAERPSTRLLGKKFEFANLPDEEIRMLPIHRNNNPEDVLIREDVDWSGIATKYLDMAQWKNPDQLEMVFEVSWAHRVVPIQWMQMLPDGRLYLKMEEHSFRASRFQDGVQISATPTYIENVFELLGEPLQWYFDPAEQMLYVGFAEGDEPKNHEIIIPMVEQILAIGGDIEKQPCKLNFENLTFSHTTWMHPQKYGMPEMQANQMYYFEDPTGEEKEKPYEMDYCKVISAIRVMAAQDVNFTNCNFTALATGALQYEYGTQNCKITGNRFYDIGGSAVTMGDCLMERAHHPEDSREIVRGIEVSNNYIHDTGKEFRGAVAIMAGYVQDVAIIHNEIHDVPYSAISLGWGWGDADVSVGPKLETKWTEPSVCMRNKIMYNHIRNCMMGLHDGGAIYTLGNMDGTVICGNYIHESSGFQGEGFDKVSIHGYDVDGVYDPKVDRFWSMRGAPGGIYLDEGSIGIEVYENVLHDVVIPLNYHNQVDKGYTMVQFRDNILNKRPGDADFPTEIAANAGLEPAYRYLIG